MLKILFITHEVTPFSSHGMAGEISESLTRAFKKTGHEVRIVTPRYRSIRERKHGLRDVARLREMYINFGGRSYPASVKSGFVPVSKVQVYFVENDDLFPETAEVKCSDEESLLQSLFLSHSALQLIAHLNWLPDIIYCCGWRTAAVPNLLKYNPLYINTGHSVKTVMHCCLQEGNLPVTQVDFNDFDLHSPVDSSQVNTLLELGLLAADCVIKPDNNSDEFVGSLMQSLCDTELAWNPQKDLGLHQNYGSADYLIGKAANKAAVQEKYGLQQLEDTMLVTLWGQLDVDQGGALVRQMTEAFPDLKLQLLTVGSAGYHTEKQIDDTLASQFRQLTTLDDSEQRLIEAASDISVHTTPPDRHNVRPLASLLYGAAPILPKPSSDISQKDEFAELGFGSLDFRYDVDNNASLIEALRNVTETFRDKLTWNELLRAGMDRDLYWELAAKRVLQKLQKPISQQPSVQ